MHNGEALLQVTDLRTCFHTSEGTVRAVDGLSLHIDRGEVLGVVGESGCGKSVTALSILRLIPIPPGEIQAEEIRFNSRNLLAASNPEMRRIRGNSISMIFQEPMTSLNPVFKVGDQIAEAIQLHQGASRREAWEKSVELLKMVGISSPEIRANSYPHQLSGGMRQRAMIAMAFSCRPHLLIADEPTTALDVTIQAQILDLMREMKENTGSAVMFITHNLGIVAENAQRVLVMYAGQAVESASVKDLFNRPLHPYTIGLLNSIPRRKAGVRGFHRSGE
jgi:oligopeptide transport system ATP-binding protein